VEINADAVRLARKHLADNKIRNVEVHQGDAKTTGIPRESFDLATARLVLVNVPEPERIVDEMVALVKPGGMVALHEADWGLNLCDPPLAAWDRLRGVLVDYSKLNGIDPLYCEAGPANASSGRTSGSSSQSKLSTFFQWTIRGGPSYCSSLRTCVIEYWLRV
jgi:SAM-dependent methyltransferase